MKQYVMGNGAIAMGAKGPDKEQNEGAAQDPAHFFLPIRNP